MLTAALYALAVMWSIGCAVCLLVLLVEFLDDLLVAALAFLLGAPFAVLIAALPWLWLDYAQSPDLATLKRSEWACSASHRETTYVQSGKVLAPISSDVCDSYTRKP